MTFNERMDLIEALRQQGIIGRELQPVSYDYKNTAYWHFEVLKPDDLPETLKAEYVLYGEIRS